MEDNDILLVQRVLRKRLFEGASAIRWRPGRELAAQLMLYLDDPQACWRITTEWLRDTLDADRVDGGFGGFAGTNGMTRDYVALAESQRNSLRLPSVLGLRFDARDPGLRSVWGGASIAAFTDVAQERAFPASMRGALLSVGTAAKLALPVRDGAEPIGLICADWNHDAPRWNTDVCNQVGELARDALGPLLAAADRLASARQPLEPTSIENYCRELPGQDYCEQDVAAVSDEAGVAVQRPAAMADLTPAEVRVARLIATGLSYKEVAKQLDRSVSTVDHQLRSIRNKLGVRSTSRLVSKLGDLL